MRSFVFKHRLALAPSIAFVLVLLAGAAKRASPVGTPLVASIAAAAAWGDMFAITGLPSPLDRFWKRALTLNLLLWSPLGGFVLVNAVLRGAPVDAAIFAGVTAYSIMFVPTQLQIRWLRSKIVQREQH